ncbi:MAG: FkbM family methyltransferase [Litorivicinaceae bacterium]|nr:FkbM family methyltransferase [Litorivicinaceae bacterium]
MEKRYRERHGIEGAVKEDVHVVPGIALDSFEASGVVSLIKIDVEGLEFEVIKGAKKFLARHYFAPILFEAWGYE